MQQCLVLRNKQQASLLDVYGPTLRTVDRLRPGFPPEPVIDEETIDWTGRNELLRDPEVAIVAPVMPTKPIAPIDQTPAKAPSGDAWGIGAVKADTSPYTGTGVVVAVLDTGIDTTHPAFTGVTLTEKDFTGTGNGDHNGHGTHCAATIFGRDVDQHRIGIARGVTTALIGKTLGDDGTGSTQALFRALTWATDTGAHVISMSIGFDFKAHVKDLIDAGWPADLATSTTLEAFLGNVRMFDALMDMTRAKQAFGTGTVITAASGNESRRDSNPNYVIAASLPAAAIGVISVGAVAQAGRRRYDIAPFSNTLPVLCAPGVDILSAKTGGGLTTKSGTSMACPHAAGVAALWWQHTNDNDLPRQAGTITAKLTANANPRPFTKNTTTPDKGAGLITAPQPHD